MKKAISLLLVIVSVFCAVSCAVSAYAAAKPTFSVTTKNNTYVITWKYDSGATKFYVFVDGKLDGTKAANKNKSYTFTTDPYTTGAMHKIQLKAEKSGKIFAESDTREVCLPPSAPVLSYTTSGDYYVFSAKITSGKATAFRLYKYNTSTKKFDFYKDFAKTIKVKSTGNPKTDTYRAKSIVTFDKKYLSAPGNTVSCTPGLVKLSSVSAKSSAAGQITLKWKAVDYTDFTAYQIIYTSYDSFDKSRKVKVAKDKSSYTLKLIPGICYKVAIRNYRTVNGKTTCSKWSDIKTLYTVATVPAKVNVKNLLNNQTKLSKAGATSNEKLNNVLDKILEKIGCGPKSTYKTYDKVRLCYRYIATEQFKKDGDFGCKGNSYGPVYAENSTLQMIVNKGKTGSCYEYNHLMHFLCLRMGLKNTYMVDGMVSSSGSGRTGHWWMMMKIGSNNYYFDPRMQRYMDNSKLNFLCLPMNGENKYSDYFRFYDAQAELK